MKDRIEQALDRYRKAPHPSLPANGLSRLQDSLSGEHSARTPDRKLLRYATAASLALVFFASGFFSGRNTADQSLPTALHFPRSFYPESRLPEIVPPAFAVALAESIPGVFSSYDAIPR